MGMPPELAALLGGHPAPSERKLAREMVMEITGIDKDAKIGDVVMVDAPRVEWLYFVGYLSSMDNLPTAMTQMVMHIFQCATNFDIDEVNTEAKRRHEEHAPSDFKPLTFSDEENGAYR